METIKEYDEIIGLIMQNVINQAYYSNGDIVLWDFDSDSLVDRLYFKVACITADLYERQIYVDMPFFKYLSLKWKLRRRKNLHRVNKKVQWDENEGRTSVYIIMDFIREYLGIDSSKFIEIDREYYGGK